MPVSFQLLETSVQAQEKATCDVGWRANWFLDRLTFSGEFRSLLNKIRINIINIFIQNRKSNLFWHKVRKSVLDERLTMRSSLPIRESLGNIALLW